MVFLFVVFLVGAYATAASWAVRRGPVHLWSTASAALLLIVAGGVVLGTYYTVPSLPLLLLYAVALAGPIVAVPTVMLSFATANRPTWGQAFPAALLGALLGFVCGVIIVVFGLRVW